MNDLTIQTRPEYAAPVCPVCGEKCTVIYITERYGDALGCEHCVSRYDAREWGAYGDDE